MAKQLTHFALFVAAIFTLSACDSGSGENGDMFADVPPPSEAQLMLAQFGTAEASFSEDGMQALLDFEDTSNPVILLQLISVGDAPAFAEFEASAETLWQSVGGEIQFASRVLVQLIGDRQLMEVRAVEFPNIMMLNDAINTAQFTAAMDQLMVASDDVVWVVGVEQVLPFEPSGSYVDPVLQGIDEVGAQQLLQGVGQENSGFDSNSQAIVDMLVSDDPSPFWMVNLIDFYEQATYPDGRETDLSGIEANQIYGQAIFPWLQAFNSLPDIIMPISAVLTKEPIDWEQAAIVRYASRDAFLNIFPLNPDLGDAIIHKEAGVENTLVYVTEVESKSLPEVENGFLYNFRYCEVLLATIEAEQLQADVYNSIGFSACPQEQWDALDAVAIAADYGVDSALLNGIRFWVLDRITSNSSSGGSSVVEDFGGIQMRLAASVTVPVTPDFTGLTDGGNYQVAEVTRDTVWHYHAGRQVYELQDPNGRRYMMQSFSQGVDRNQQLVDLQFLGQRLALPQGWSFSTRVLAEGFDLASVDGLAEVLTDNFSNTYQYVPGT